MTLPIKKLHGNVKCNFMSVFRFASVSTCELQIEHIKLKGIHWKGGGRVCVSLCVDWRGGGNHFCTMSEGEWGLRQIK